jgi:hypothetical protein
MNAGKKILTTVLLYSLLCGVRLQAQTVGTKVDSVTAPDRPSPAVALLEGSTSRLADSSSRAATEAPSAQTTPAGTPVAYPHRSHHLRNIVIITAAVTVMVVVLASLDK